MSQISQTASIFYSHKNSLVTPIYAESANSVNALVTTKHALV